jgi:hypothetical protein
LTKEHGLFNKYNESFLAAEIAWFVAGASDDGNHRIQPHTFHPWFQISREHLPVGRTGNKIRNEGRSNLRQLAFDLVGLLCDSDMFLTDVIDRPRLGIVPMEDLP